MKHIKKILLVLCIIPFAAIGQTIKESKAKIDNIEFFLVEDHIVIRYDLMSTKKSERYDIQVEIYKGTNDVKIDARTFNGDILNQVPGRGKLISWEMADDISYLDENIYVLLEAIHLNPKTISYTPKKIAYLQSTAFPGWGTSKITLKKIHILKGVAAYSLIGLSIKSNSNAVNYYESYKAAEDSRSRDDYFKKAEKSYQNSFYYIGGAAAIWLVEYLWIYLVPNKTDASKISENKISINYNYFPTNKTPVLTLTYKF